MADRDDYRGYRDDNGRYADRGHFDQDYERQGGSPDRDRYRQQQGGQSYGANRTGYGHDQGESRGGDHDRGVMGRAGDTVRGWFSDDDDHRDRSQSDRHRGGLFSGGGDYDRDHPQYRGGGGIRGGQGSDDNWRNLRNQDRSRYSEGMNRRDEGEWHGRGIAGQEHGRYGVEDQDRFRGYGPRGQQPWGGGDMGGRDFGTEYSTGRYGSGGPALGGAGDYRGDRDFEGDRMSDRVRNLGTGYGAQQAGRTGGGAHPDDHYHSWRQQQIDALDRDYDEYRREHRDKFHSEFGGWRETRQQQRASLGKVGEHMEVVGTDGQKVGVVDKVQGDRIILTKNDPTAGGHHHSIPCSWVQSVDDKVTINKSAQEAMQQWRDEENRRALFENPNQRKDEGPHILDRSFSGTYGDDNK